MTKTSILSSSYMRHHILFHMRWRVAWIVTVDFWFPSLLFSLLIGNVQHCSFLFLLFNSSPHSLNLIFCSFFLFIEVFVSFQFNIYFLILILILLIFYFFLISCIESFFNLVLQLQFLICFVFHFDLFLLYFFLTLLLKFFLLSIL
jgi:hypothetical protein